MAERVKPKWISDHLCWTGIHQRNMHDLLPLPYTEKTINHVVERVHQVQDFYKQRILLENVSSYITYKGSEMTEWEFLTEITNKADCLILLDLNNIYVSAYNHGFNPEIYLNHIPINRVQQFHLAGHLNCGDTIIDTHNHPIINEVWNLYAQAIKRFGDVSTMIERDDNIPSFEELQQELEQAKAIQLTLKDIPTKNSGKTEEEMVELVNHYTQERLQQPIDDEGIDLEDLGEDEALRNHFGVNSPRNF